MNRRSFLAAAAALGVAPLVSRLAQGASISASSRAGAGRMAGAYQLPPLPYAYDALEPHIDALTLQIHHDRHHAASVSSLNAALEKHPELQAKSLEDLLGNLDRVPEDIRTAVRNNGGGHINHTMFWEVMGPKAGGPATGAIADAIGSAFGSFDAFKDQFTRAAVGQFGSGWAWLVDSKGKLTIESTPGHDTPLMGGRKPVLVVDVWEHAYYLKYQNRRADFIAAWWNLVNWAEVNRRFGK